MFQTNRIPKMSRANVVKEFKKLIAYLNEQKSFSETWNQSKNVTSIVADLLEQRKAIANNRNSCKTSGSNNSNLSDLREEKQTDV